MFFKVCQYGLVVKRIFGANIGLITKVFATVYKELSDWHKK